jgi:antitoxin CcdA
MANVRPDRTACSDQTRERATDLSLSRDVLAAAKAQDINISAVRDEHLRDVALLKQQHHWQAHYADFIDVYNATVDAEGLPLEQWRTF